MPKSSYSTQIPKARLSSTPPPPLVTSRDVEQELRRLFKGPTEGLVIRVYGEPPGSSSPEALAAFREMFSSLRMYDERYRKGSGDILVDAPDRKVLSRALAVLAKEEHQKRILDRVLTTFGRRLIDPLGAILDTTPEGSIMARLSVLRDIFLAQIADLHLTHESQQVLSEDVRKMLNDEYLSMVAEHEERVQRPRVRRLAQKILRLVGATFHRALRSWPDHADQIASAIARRISGKVRLQDIPGLIKSQMAAGIEEFLWVETSTEIEGALAQLFAENKALVSAPPQPLDRTVYRDFAEACWELIAEHC